MSEALRLADLVEHDPLTYSDEAAAELRRLSAELERQLEEARKDAERWRTFLSTRPQSTHEVIIQAIDDAAMQKCQS